MAKTSFGCLLGISIFWCGITGTGATLAVAGIARHFDAERRFKTVEGTVISSEVSTSRGSKGRTLYRPDIRTRYGVHGKEFVSDRYTLDAQDFSGGEARCRWTVRDFPPGRTVPVYYDPDRPEVAVLSLKAPTRLWFILLFMQPFLAIGAGMIWGLITYYPEQRRLERFLGSTPEFPWSIPSWGVMESSGGVLEVEYRPSRVMSSGGVYLISTFFASALIVVFFGGFSDPPGWVVAAGFAASAALAVGGGLRWAARRRKRIRLDPGAGCLFISGAKGEERRAFAEIGEFRILRPLRRVKGGMKPGSPVLSAILKAGGEVVLHEFETTWDPDGVARKAGEVVARAAGVPLRVAGPHSDPA